MFFQADSFLITNRCSSECWLWTSSMAFCRLLAGAVRFKSWSDAKRLPASKSVPVAYIVGFVPGTYLRDEVAVFARSLIWVFLFSLDSTVVMPNRIFLL